MSHNKTLGKDTHKSSPYTRKTVRFSNKNQEKEGSPSLKKYTRENTYSKEDRKRTIQAIRKGFDKDFNEYMQERRKNQTGLPVKEYRSQIIQFMKNREKALEQIRKTRKSKSPTTPSRDRKHSQTKKRITPQLLSTPTPSSSSKNTSSSLVNRLKKIFF